jgi:hypothetical protein
MGWRDHWGHRWEFTASWRWWWLNRLSWHLGGHGRHQLLKLAGDGGELYLDGSQPSVRVMNRHIVTGAVFSLHDVSTTAARTGTRQADVNAEITGCRCSAPLADENGQRVCVSLAT